MNSQPLLLPPATATASATATTSNSTPSIVTRILIILGVAALASWAHFEASKGFDIVVLSGAAGTAADRRFQLLFESDDKVFRLILNASDFLERFLYPNKDYPKKVIHRLNFHLVDENVMTNLRLKVETGHLGEVTLMVSSAVMEEAYPYTTIASLVRRGMALAWLWDGQQQAPEYLLAAVAESIGMMLEGWSSWDDPKGVSPESGELCWTTEEEKSGGHLYVARFLRYCEGVRPGFLARLNRAMQEGWHVGMVEQALGLPVQQLCSQFRSASHQLLGQPRPVHELEEWLRIDM